VHGISGKLADQFVPMHVHGILGQLEGYVRVQVEGAIPSQACVCFQRQGTRLRRAAATLLALDISVVQARTSAHRHGPWMHAPGASSTCACVLATLAHVSMDMHMYTCVDPVEANCTMKRPVTVVACSELFAPVEDVAAGGCCPCAARWHSFDGDSAVAAVHVQPACA
jgi:hypothetical protein